MHAYGIRSRLNRKGQGAWLVSSVGASYCAVPSVPPAPLSFFQDLWRCTPLHRAAETGATEVARPRGCCELHAGAGAADTWRPGGALLAGEEGIC